MRYMLDTDICSYVIRRHAPRLLATMQTRARSGAEISISAVTYAELRLGAERSRNAVRHHALVRSFCERLSGVMAWGRDAADAYARIQGRLFDAGTPIGRNDTMIAAHALALGCVLVTNNERHFSKVGGIALENWLRR